MRNATTVLAVIRERGRRGLPLEDVYRQLYNRELYLVAYGRIYRNDGAMTRGATEETVDGMSLAKIDAIIDALRQERYRWTPARRVQIPKKNGKLRPLGLPTWSDKLLQEVVRLLLDAYFEPQFSDRSHGFRPGRGCHTALRAMQDGWLGTAWFIEGDIAQCFDRLDHAVLLDALRERIHDGRFLRLLANLLEAGYLEDWTFNATLSGTPQGGVVSPILSNIYLDRLDKFVETTLLPAHNRGTKRKKHRQYKRLGYAIERAVRQGDHKEAQRLRREAQRLPSVDPDDPAYRRLKYLRYADDFLLGFNGPRAEAEGIKQQLRVFLRDQLKLELSEEKTLITHARTEAARFLGYEVVALHADDKHTHGQRSINGRIGLKVPRDVIRAKCAAYMRRGKPVHRPERLHDTPYSIVAQYQAEYRGLAQYYRLAFNLRHLDRLKWVMETSLTKTLAAKLRLSVQQVYTKFAAVIPTPAGPYKGLHVVAERGDGRAPLVAHWGGITLRRQRDAVLDERPPAIFNDRTELLERLLAETCELCGSRDNIEVHHVRGLRDLERGGRKARPDWVKVMAARRRKTLVVCRACHDAIHAGTLRRHHDTNRDTGEPDDAKVSRPVRRGADGKVPA